MLESEEEASEAETVAGKVQKRYEEQRHEAGDRFRFQLHMVPDYIGSIRMVRPRVTSHHTVKRKLSEFAHSTTRTAYRAVTVIQSRAYICADNAVMKLDLRSGVIQTIAGGAARGHKDGIGSSAQFDKPTAVSARAVGVDLDLVYVVDSGNNVVRRLMVKHAGQAAQVTTVVKGSGQSQRFRNPNGIAFGGVSSAREVVYVSDDSSLWQLHVQPQVIVIGIKAPKSTPANVSTIATGLSSTGMRGLEIAAEDDSNLELMSFGVKCNCVVKFKLNLSRTGVPVVKEILRLPSTVNRMTVISVRAAWPGHYVLHAERAESDSRAGYILSENEGQLRLEQQLAEGFAQVGVIGAHGMGSQRHFPTLTTTNQFGLLEIGLELPCKPWMLEKLAKGWVHNSTTEDPSETGLLQHSASVELDLSSPFDGVEQRQQWRFWGARKLQDITSSSGASSAVASTTPLKLSKHMLCFRSPGYGNRGCCTTKSLNWPKESKVPSQEELNALLQGF